MTDHTYRSGMLPGWHGGFKGALQLGGLDTAGEASPATDPSSCKPLLPRRPPEDSSMECLWPMNSTNTEAMTRPTSYIADLCSTTGGLDFGATI